MPGLVLLGQRTAALKLFLLGFLGLYLELGLIRYLAGSVWNLGYFPNLVLIAAFMGMGWASSCTSESPGLTCFSSSNRPFAFSCS